MDNLGDLLNKRMRQKGLAGPLEASKIVFLANQLDISFKAVKLKNKILYCEVINPKDALKLKIDTSKYIEAINTKIRHKVVDKIVWRSGRG